MKIILPRNDSKLDNERRTEKDFREAVGRAEQLFRALHETRDLNLYNIFIKRWIWGKPYFSFELQYENEELSFVVVCDQYYQNIVEKQITSFYESAEVMEIPLEERFMMRKFRDQGLSANGYYLHLKKQYWFPIQTYKKIEDDPLNTIANSFSGLTERDKAAVQIVMHPRNHRWRPKARQKGTDLFKGEYNRWEINIPVIGTVLKYLLLPFQLLLFGTAGREDDLGLTNAPGATGGDHYVRMLQTDEEIAKSIGDKANQPGFVCAVRLVVATESNTRTDSVLNAMFVAWNVFFARGMNQFENRRIIPIDSLNAPIMLHNFDLRLFDFLEHDSILTPEELATMYHFPDARYNKISTIKW
ncbi:MAG: hypothetical protein KDD44_14670, partial [Bdellovibrionales bacterium]|nr:hypothetical protein [Bdellovibrionales bacterium]